MNGFLLPAVPLGAAALLALAPGRVGAWIALGAAGLTLAVACWFAADPPLSGPWLLADPLARHMALLIAFLGVTSAVAGVGSPAAEPTPDRTGPPRIAGQVLAAALLAASLSGTPALAWAAMAVATLAALAGERRDSAIGADWHAVVLIGTALSLALFGTVLLARAAPGSPALASLACICLLVGYGTLAGLAPLHGWTVSAAPVAAGPFAAVALMLLLRFRHLFAAGAGALPPGLPLLLLGLASVLVGGLALGWQRELRRWLAFAAVAQNGVAAVAFGLGGPASVLAGLLQITVIALLHSAILPLLARAARLRPAPGFAPLRGLLPRHRALGLTLAALLLALAGLPPFGLFASLFLALTQSVQQAPWAALPLAAGMLAAAAALVRRVQPMVQGAPARQRGPASPHWTVLAPAWLHLALALLLGAAMPAPVAAWFARLAETLG